MRKIHPYFFLLFTFLFIHCENFGRLTVKAKLSKLLKEVSGIQYDAKRDAFWMVNDSGSSASVFLVKEDGTILHELKIDADNNDWEDLTMDLEGNLYIGDFGNNGNERKNLRILKIDKNDLDKKGKVSVEETKFIYPEQEKFPPKKKERHYDTEGFFEWNGNFYMFTKSRVKDEIGRTFLYKVSNREDSVAKQLYDSYRAKRISEFTTCKKEGCWITGADISKDGTQVVLLHHKSAWIFTDFKDDAFFSGKAQEFSFGHESQKESITFKDNNTLYIADEQEGNLGRNLYAFRLN